MQYSITDGRNQNQFEEECVADASAAVLGFDWTVVAEEDADFISLNLN